MNQRKELHVTKTFMVVSNNKPSGLHGLYKNMSVLQGFNNSFLNLLFDNLHNEPGICKEIRLKGQSQAKIIKKSVILFWFLI